mgnify:CR=1 FL=1
MEKLRIGWREWVGLPGFGIPAIKAKVDTGARTSSLHALDPELFTERGMPHVRFMLLPVQGTLWHGQVVHAPLVDRRRVTNSGGDGHERYVIHLDIELGGQSLPVEVTLANRRDMRFRMLLGRQALDRFLIEPSESFLLPKTPAQKTYLRELRQMAQREAGR